jgi:hypothetical protein
VSTFNAFLFVTFACPANLFLPTLTVSGKWQPGLLRISTALIVKKTTCLNIGILIASMLTASLAGELLIRAFGKYDADGNFFFGSFRLYPHRLPVKQMKEKVETYLSSGSPLVVYDDSMGWTYRPGAASRDGLYYIGWY